MTVLARYRLEPQILRVYALVSAFLFAALIIFYLTAVPEAGIAKAMHLIQVKAYSLFFFVLVVGSTIFGMIYHHIHRMVNRRNTFAFVFSASMIKLIFGIVVLSIF